MIGDALDRARAGDLGAFDELVGRHRRELHVHCYRMLGSFHDAEDALQETLLGAWRGIARFEGSSSLRTWLYRIATNHCLNVLRAERSRPEVVASLPGPAPDTAAVGEVTWLQPYPDALLADLDEGRDPAASAESREAISLAFVRALQLLNPRQRAVVVLRDVLDYSTTDVGEMLEMTADGVASTLKRARARLDRAAHAPEPALGAAVEERVVLERLVAAFGAGDIDALVALLADDVRISMPPVPLEYHGIDAVREFFAAVVFGAGRRYHLVPTGANGQPAFAAYVDDPHTPVRHVAGLLVVSVTAGRVERIDRFDNDVLAAFGLPTILAAGDRAEPAGTG